MRRIVCAWILLMATGTVELVGTQIGTAGSYGGDPAYVKAKALDGDFTTFSASPNASGDWIGVDAGAACTVVEVRFAPRRGYDHASRFNERTIVGAKVQASSSSTFASDVTDVDTIPSAPYYPSLNFNSRTISGAPSKQYWRWINPSYYCEMAELRFIANAGPTAAKPVAPVLSPMGGRHPTGSTRVTLTSGTTSADLYYTTDGTTPTSSSTHYTGPFTLSIGGSGTTLKVIAIDATLTHTDSDVVSALYVPWGYKPREDWKDDRGVLIEAHSGGFLKEPGGEPKLVNGCYWWVGTLANAFNYIGADSNGAYGICAYTTTDFYNFTYVGEIISQPLPYGTGLVYRPHVVYHSGTAKYVLWATNALAERAVVATADAMAGPWTVTTTTLNPDGLGYKDCHLYHASDGRVFTTYVASTQNQIFISELDVTNGYLTTTGSPVQAIAGYRESPVLGEYPDGAYFLHHSTQNYADDELTYDQRVSTATDPLGTWGSSVASFVTDPVGTLYNGQISDALRFTTGGVVVLVDAFIHASMYDDRYVWLPYRSGIVETPASWDLASEGFTLSSMPSSSPRVPWLRP